MEACAKFSRKPLNPGNMQQCQGLCTKVPRPLHEVGKGIPKLQWRFQEVEDARTIDALRGNFQAYSESVLREVSYTVDSRARGRYPHAVGAQMSPFQSPDAGSEAVGFYVCSGRSWSCYGLSFLCYALIPLLSDNLYAIMNSKYVTCFLFSFLIRGSEQRDFL